MKLWLPYSNICILANNTTRNLLILIKYYVMLFAGLFEKNLPKVTNMNVKSIYHMKKRTFAW